MPILKRSLINKLLCSKGESKHSTETSKLDPLLGPLGEKVLQKCNVSANDCIDMAQYYAGRHCLG